MTECETPNDASVRALTGFPCVERHERVMCPRRAARGRRLSAAEMMRARIVLAILPTRRREGRSPHTPAR